MAHLAHYKEAHPMPMRVTHWVNLFCMAFLIFSGFLIHFPFWAALTGVARGLHVFLGIVLLVNCIVRIVLAFLLQTAPTGGTRNLVRDYKTWLPQADNRHQLGSWIKYYLFLKKDHPLSAKLGVPQKISYLAVAFLILIMAYTGFCLWVPTASWTFFAAGTSLVGGMMSMRIIHYFMMFVFIIFSMLHIYLVFIEGSAPAKLMLLGKEHGGKVYDPNRHVIVGEDHSVDNH
ncbi:MAG: cytochrome b/b6 domain-containing protein [Eggerthellaceae bacterium]